MEEKNEKKGLFSKFKQTRFYRSINTFASSAIIGLGITLLIFAYKVYSGRKQFDVTVDRLDNISRSLSTRCLGKFPAYISEINEVFSTLQPGDTVVIFEDVLYYGIKSDPVGFGRLQQHLLNHSRQGGKVIVAYYDNHNGGENNSIMTVFHRMILESRIAPKYLTQMSEERFKRLEQMGDNSVSQDKETRMREFVKIDSILTEEFYALTRDNDIEAAQNVVKGYLSFYDAIKQESSPSVQSDAVVNNLCSRIDSIVHRYLGCDGEVSKKSVKKITFADYEKMYIEITDCIADFYRYHGIELIPLNEYLTMSCWLVKPVEKNRQVASILAFPSKYSSDEIGFYSQDELFSEYIMTILQGVRGNFNESKERQSNF